MGFRYLIKDKLSCEDCFYACKAYDCPLKRCYNKDSKFWAYHLENHDKDYCLNNPNNHCCPYEEHKL
jgi:hypothetical protein